MGNYADGRPASQAGGSVRYDAGGSPHVIPSAPEQVSRTRRVATDAEAARRSEEVLMRAQMVDLGNQMAALRLALQHILDTTTDGDVRAMCREALK